MRVITFFYQWGRYAPFPGGRWNNTTKEVEDVISSDYSIQKKEIPLLMYGESYFKALSQSVAEPNIFYFAEYYGNYLQSNSQASDFVSNLWCTRNNHVGAEFKSKSIMTVAEQGPYKSVYDPSPLGYMIPEAFAFHYFTKENLLYSIEKNGLIYYESNGQSKQQTKLFFPFSGFRNGDNGTFYMGKQKDEQIGQCHTSLLHNSQSPYHFCISNRGVIFNPHYENSKLLDGISVRPIRELTF